MSVTVITKRIEFDAGHRVPDHASKCRSPHGHRYVVEVAVSGVVADRPGDPENGMVKDFAFIKELLVEHVHDPWDHAFLIAEHDEAMLRALVDGWADNTEAPWKVAIVPVVPTVENLTELVYVKLAAPVALAGAYLDSVTMWETPTCSATYRA